jgi:hypothetical protein
VNNNKYIFSHCRVTKNVVYKNGQKIFDKPNANPQDFLFSTFEYFNLNYSKFYKMDSLSKLGWLASEILLAGENIIKDVKPRDIGIVLSNAKSSLDMDIKYLHSVQEFASPALFVYTLPNIVIGEVCISNDIKGENAFFIFEDFNAAFTEQYVSHLLDNNILQLCICGWVEFLRDNYKAVLFLAGKNDGANDKLFSRETMDSIFNNQAL